MGSYILSNATYVLVPRTLSMGNKNKYQIRNAYSQKSI